MESTAPKAPSISSLPSPASSKQGVRVQFAAGGRVPQNKKHYHPKVTTGCLTCKQRHVKCDETKPVCTRCTKTGRKCDGYVIRKPWMFEPSWEKSAKETQGDALVGTAASSPSYIKTEQGTESERWNFQYFCEVTIPTVAGWTFASGSDDFWHGLVPQYAQSVPAIRHLTVALASRHRDTSSLSTDQSPFASREYVKALAKLTRPDEETSVDTVILSCLLIASYEHFDPHAVSYGGLSHHAAAFRIFNDPATKWSPMTRAIYSKVQQMETVISILKTPVFLHGAKFDGDVQENIPTLPEAFASPAEMQRKFFEIFRWRFLYSLRFPAWDHHCSGFLQVLDLLSRWYMLTCNYISENKGKKQSRDDLQLATTMSIQFRMFHTALWYSVNEDSPKHQHPGHANLVDLSSLDKVIVHIPAKSDPRSYDAEAHPVGTTGHKQIGIWPEVSSPQTPGKPLYFRITLYADGGNQDHVGPSLER